MKKILVVILFLFSMTVFAEKLTTDGKYNIEKLQGKWGSETVFIQKRNNKWYYGSYNVGDDVIEWSDIKFLKNGVMMVQNFYSYQIKGRQDRNYYFAYDTKYKILVELDRNLNIVDKIPRKYSKPIGQKIKAGKIFQLFFKEKNT